MAGGKGEKLSGKAPPGHWLTQTFVAGLCHRDILAPMLLPCAMTGEFFRQWLVEALIPELEPGSIVVLDNPSRTIFSVRLPESRPCREPFRPRIAP